jgi:hypothetical protein
MTRKEKTAARKQRQIEERIESLKDAGGWVIQFFPADCQDYDSQEPTFSSSIFFDFQKAKQSFQTLVGQGHNVRIVGA